MGSQSPPNYDNPALQHAMNINCLELVAFSHPIYVSPVQEAYNFEVGWHHGLTSI